MVEIFKKINICVYIKDTCMDFQSIWLCIKQHNASVSKLISATAGNDPNRYLGHNNGRIDMISISWTQKRNVL